MTPLARFAASLFSSLLLAGPVLLAGARGATDLESAVLRWAIAFIGATVAFGVIGRILDAYHVDPDEPEAGDGTDPATPDDEALRRYDDGRLATS